MRATAARSARVGYERTDEDVANPALVRSFSLETAKDARTAHVQVYHDATHPSLMQIPLK